MKIKGRIIILSLFYFSGLMAQAQSARVDSIWQAIVFASHDTTRMIHYNEIGDIYGTSNPDSALHNYYKAKQIAEKIIITSSDSLSLLDVAKRHLANSLISIGVIYRHRSQMYASLKYYQNSLNLYEEVGDKMGMAQALNNIGVIYRQQGDVERAKEYYQLSYVLRKEIDDKIGMSHSLNNLGVIFRMQNDNKSALDFYTRSLQIKQEIGDIRGEALTLRNVGMIYFDQGDISKSLEYFSRSVQIREEIDDRRGVASSLVSLGEAYLKLNNYTKAYESGNRAYALGKELDYPQIVERASRLMKDIYLIRGNYKKAFMYFAQEVEMRDSVANEEKLRETLLLQARYDFEKKSIADSILYIKTLKVKDEELKRQKVTIYALVFVFFSMIILAFLIYRSYLIKREANKTITKKNLQLEQAFEEIKTVSETLANQNEKLKIQNEEIVNQHKAIEEQKNSLANLAWELQDKSEEIEQQRNILSSKNKDITDSILYAQRIQNAVLPTPNDLSNYFKQHFVTFFPKSIVSGDFYWATRIRELLVFCVTDCTGHGVPGAFMSIMGTSFLNEIVRKEEVTNAAEVLNMLRQFVVSSLMVREEEDVLFDGMDIGFCILNTQTLKLQYAGANIPCWIATSDPSLSNNNRIEYLNGLVELKPDRMPIGRFEHMNSFSFVEYQLKTNDTLYLASDGFADQFGGKNEKKFQKVNLMRLLSQINDKPMKEQKELLEKTFADWKGELMQIDDVTLMGVRV